MEFYLKHLYGINIGNEICCIIFSVIVLVAMMMRGKKTKETNAFAFFVITIILSMISDLVAYLYHGDNGVVVIVVTSCITYSMVALSIYGFFSYMVCHAEVYYGAKYSPNIRVLALAYITFCIAFYLSSLWTGVIFTVSDAGEYVLGDKSYLSGMMQLPILVGQFIVVFKNIRRAPVRETILYSLLLTLFAVLGILDATYMTTMHYLGMTIMISLIYIMVELEQEKLLDTKRRELAISELNALRLQMNPHYIYNVLASIDGLIMLDPNEARHLVGKFIKHLRGSYLDDMPEKVDVKLELRNLGYYLDVEKTRFPNINVEFDIQADDFQVPPLVIQPMVENAVKNGICGKEDSRGTITIQTYETETTYDVVIKDDGVGYDVNAKPDDSRHHVGIINTRKRLELICNGRLELNSIVGLGSEAHIIIPKE